jgi:hypothetical protein
MDDLINSMDELHLQKKWLSKFNADLNILASQYAHEFYENICFVPYEAFDKTAKTNLINYLCRNNNARALLSEKICELYPNETINMSDLDSIMDYYIFSLEITQFV